MSERLRKELEEMQAGEVDPIGTGKRLVETYYGGVRHAVIEQSDRKKIPLCSGVLDYFPAALAAVAKLSHLGNEKHNPGEPLHWARDKSTDHADCIARHLVDRGLTDPDTGLSHSVEVAWRALALLQEELERAGAPKARGAK